MTPPFTTDFVPFAQAIFWENPRLREPANPALALSYANLVLGFWRDCKNKYPGNPEPLYIFELEAADARFSYLFLQSFFEQFDAIATPADRVLYVLTDADAGALNTVRHHEKLTPFIKQGRLDFAHFTPQTPGVINLLEANAPLVPHKMVYPPVVIANGVFSQLRQDMFFIEQHTLYEAWVASADNEVEQEATENKPHGLHYQKRPLTGTGYSNETHTALLEYYRQTLPNCSLLFPYQVFNLLKMLNTLQGQDLLLLCADQGMRLHTELTTYTEHQPTSNPVPPLNFHALERIIQAQGGQLWRSVSEGAHSNSVFAAAISASNLWPETQRAALQSLTRFNPNDTQRMHQTLAEEAEYLSLPDMLAFLRAHHWDSQLFSAFLPYLQLNGLNKTQQDLWRSALARIWAHHLPLPSDNHDLAFDLATVAASMHRWRYALDLFHQSLSFKGPQAATLANIGIAHWQMGDLQKAESALRKAVALWATEQQQADETEESSVDTVERENPIQAQLDALGLWQSKCRSLLGPTAQVQAKTSSHSQIYLTLLGTHQAEALYLHQRQTLLARQVGVRALNSVRDAHNWIKQERANNKTPLAIMHPQCGLIGLAVLETRTPLHNGTHNVARFYYWITPDHQNQGHGTQALALLHQFTAGYGIKYLFSAVHRANLKSQRAMAKTGYERLHFALTQGADPENALDYYLKVLRPGAAPSEFERYQAFAAFIQTFAEPIELAPFEGDEALEVTRLKLAEPTSVEAH